ncbi:TPA: host cell division inhibitor Icd-like protein [Klebsiella pneumoniae subsp. pneumoniae]|uniref:host cell division inhibitor Icd-like protein n=1 Tax=Klebsiella pneumoniae TaxID=573 RepID=UPI001B317FD4|nr:host cell division inhibitor Icd-like protein [Klebsiella pneumoniae]HDS2300438.1 host cell division inhibitor Icd-like protein [Klebsiella pneumoniae subsp. pneumoniae]MBP3113403.1 host cell division inhibitor Icd-like protein [Klebsiella pneumoniae]HBQ6874974.1 host cell division inhibitor Icd-like protein [Klebsiella pneumoniae]HBS6924048.1 host cell division inhibitor Icd-like protein [Klebsiella pneumoniae]HDS6832333.1 host cell division inhibitor Icd-like protein [Klebsiella pneumonia
MITSIQGNSLSMAGLLANVSTLRVLRSHGNLSKPVTLRVTEGGAQNAGWNFWNRNSDSFNTCSKNFCESIKNGLMFYVIQVYGYCAPAKSGAGIGVSESLQATYDAPCVFFCVVNSVHPFFCVAGIIRVAHKIMVGWMGAEKSAPVSCNAGYANPVQSTTSEIGVSGGGFQTQLQEAATMATTPTPTQNPQFIWIIAAILRDSQFVTVKIFHVTAVSEREARRTLVRDHICFFAGRIRLTEVDHA